MTVDDITRSEKTTAGAMALVMHVVFFTLLFVSVSWQQTRPDTAAIVDLWASLPPLPQPKAEPPPPEVKPEPPKPLPRVEPRPEPKPEPKPVPKPDIALQEKLEKERKLREQKLLEEKKQLAELKKKEEEKKRLAALKAQKEKEAAAAREKELQAALRAAEAKEAARTAAAAAQAQALAEYSRLVSERIKRFIVLPPGLQGNPQAEFEVVQIPGGEVLSVRLQKSSGVPAYDAAVERAIRQAQPLPGPLAPLAFSDVRELNLRFRPKE